MPYTQATVLELTRYTSIASLSLPHSNTKEVSIQGQQVPAGSFIITNLYAMHHDETFWKNPYDFQPEKFLDERGQLVSASHPNRRYLMPFGAGPRVCIGEILAKSRMFLIISSLAQNFNIRRGKISASFDCHDMLPGSIVSSPEFEITADERK